MLADKGNGLNKTKYFRSGREFGHRKRQKAEEGEKEHKLTQNIFLNIPSELVENMADGEIHAEYIMTHFSLRMTSPNRYQPENSPPPVFSQE